MIVYAAKSDTLATVKDAKFLYDNFIKKFACVQKIKDLCRYQEIEGGHLSFFIGKDKSYM